MRTQIEIGVIRRPSSLGLALLFATGLFSGSALAQTFDSTSTGEDGALSPTCRRGGDPCVIEFDPGSADFPNIDVDGDNVFNFTTITIPANVTLRLRGQHLNMKPVWWLASGAVQINGVVDISGEQGHPGAVGVFVAPALPGPGGFPGGPANQNGFGPGGGGKGTQASHAAGGGGFAANGLAGNTAPGGVAYGNGFCIPLIGGSGGGGGLIFGTGVASGGGGGGGGGLVFASSTSIAIGGSILAKGGRGGDDMYAPGALGGGGGGSGGAVRLLAPVISGSGAINVAGGSGGTGGIAGGNGSSGRVRLEAFQNTLTLSNVVGSLRAVALSPSAVFLPEDFPSIEATQITDDSVTHPIADPNGTFSPADVIIDAANPAVVDLSAVNIPLGAPANALVEFYVFSETDGLQIITADPLTGSFQASATNADVPFSHAFSLVFVRARWTP